MREFQNTADDILLLVPSDLVSLQIGSLPACEKVQFTGRRDSRVCSDGEPMYDWMEIQSEARLGSGITGWIKGGGQDVPDYVSSTPCSS